MNLTAEHKRLEENSKQPVPLEFWGPYLSERQWGTVREDYSQNGDAWNYFTHDQARSRCYRWGEDGIGGISDYFGNICFAIALWNGKDPILKERLFGLTNGEGNHGEDVKELYYYLDNLPSHYYMKYLYKYPVKEYPYLDLIHTNHNRNKREEEYEILDTGVFNDNQYFDVVIEYAKENSTDIFIKIEVINRSHQQQKLSLLPTLWLHNRWQYKGGEEKPVISYINNQGVKVSGKFQEQYLFFQATDQVLFTENETNFQKLFNKPNNSEFTKDGFHDAVINNQKQKYIDKKQGTKCAPLYELSLEPAKSAVVYLRLVNKEIPEPFVKGFEKIFSTRKTDADEFYATIITADKNTDLYNIQRQAFAGLLWSKQFYHFDVETWLTTTDQVSPFYAERLYGRNHSWKYLKNKDVISMPDKWEYPWYAAWDAAFHAITMALVDPVFAKNQLILLMREWYMNPEGQLPAYEWDFSDVNPPVHALASLEVYQIEKKQKGIGDIDFLKKVFQKLIINFTWWTNRKDINGNNIFEGGFLGLDNIGIFNRSMKLPGEVELEQTDGTSWMGVYALNMMDIAIEIATYDKSFEDSATKFYEHFVIIAEALNQLGLWDDHDNFFYDVLCLDGKDPFPLRVRSVVGLIPSFAASVISKEQLKNLPDFTKRMEWFKNYRIANNQFLPSEQGDQDKILLSLVHKDKLQLLLNRFLNESEFLSQYGIRAVSKVYENNPYVVQLAGESYSIEYDPADSTSNLFGGNSNWRGPVWMPINYLFVRSLLKYGSFYGNSFKVECPSGSGNYLNLTEAANFLTGRIVSVFQKNDQSERACFNSYNWFYKNEGNDLVQFNEYFHGNTGKGLGASHQTGWTALFLNLINKK